MQRLPPAVLPHGPDTPAAPLQAHLLRTVPGDDIPAEERAPGRVLPAVPPGHLYRAGAQPAGGPVGRPGAVGADTRGRSGGRGGEGGGGGWTETKSDSAEDGG